MSDRMMLTEGLLIPRRITVDCFCPFDMNITEYIKNSDINMARSVGVWVRKIIVSCNFHDSKILHNFERNFNKWKNEYDVLIHEECERETYKYGRSYTRVLYFNKFKIIRESDDGYTEYFAFGELSESEIEILSKADLLKQRDFYDSHKDLDLLRIAYGMVNRYPEIVIPKSKFEESRIGVIGIVPGIIEPTTQQVQDYENLFKKRSGK